MDILKKRYEDKERYSPRGRRAFFLVFIIIDFSVILSMVFQGLEALFVLTQHVHLF